MASAEEVAELSERVSQLTTRLEAKESENASLQNAVSNLSSRLAQMETELKELKSSASKAPPSGSSKLSRIMSHQHFPSSSGQPLKQPVTFVILFCFFPFPANFIGGHFVRFEPDVQRSPTHVAVLPMAHTSLHVVLIGFALCTVGVQVLLVCLAAGWRTCTVQSQPKYLSYMYLPIFIKLTHSLIF